MITYYSGTGGSGKSLHMAREARDQLVIRRKSVIANFPLNMDVVTRGGKKKAGEYIYLRNDQLTVKYLVDHARKYHKSSREGQTLVIIDEAAMMFNSRDYGRPDRKEWINFFLTHRHYGYNFIMASPFDRLIDRQIRSLFEYEVKHRKINNFKFIGFLLTILRIPTFCAVTYWYGVRERCGAEFFRYRKRDGMLYDTMMLFGGDEHGMRICEDSTDVESVPEPAKLTLRSLWVKYGQWLDKLLDRLWPPKRVVTQPPAAAPGDPQADCVTNGDAV